MRVFLAAVTFASLALLAPTAQADVQGQLCNGPMGACVTTGPDAVCAGVHAGTDLEAGACIDAEHLDVVVCSSIETPFSEQACYEIA